MGLNKGQIFENIVRDHLQKINGIDVMYNEQQLRSRFGWQSVGVDFLIVKGREVIAIQTKYRKTRRREDHGINNFIKSLEYILCVSDLRLHRGFWVSRIKPFDDNISYLSSLNVSCLYDFDCMETLANRLTNCIKYDFLQH